MADETPVDDVLAYMAQGLSESEIIRRLTEDGHSPVQIADALNQAKIKKEISRETDMRPSILETKEDYIPRPSRAPKPMAMAPGASAPIITTQGPVTVTAEYPTYPYQYPTYEEPQQPKMETEAIEEIAEEIVNEKWLEIKSKVMDVIEWKTYAEKRINSLDERIKRIELSMDRLQAALLSKVQEYGRNVKDLGSEMAGLEGAFGKILSPFVDNMKELNKITGDLKIASAKAKPQIIQARKEVKPAIKIQMPAGKKQFRIRRRKDKSEKGKVVEVTKTIKTIHK